MSGAHHLHSRHLPRQHQNQALTIEVGFVVGCAAVPLRNCGISVAEVRAKSTWVAYPPPPRDRRRRRSHRKFLFEDRLALCLGLSWSGAWLVAVLE